MSKRQLIEVKGLFFCRINGSHERNKEFMLSVFLPQSRFFSTALLPVQLAHSLIHLFIH